MLKFLRKKGVMKRILWVVTVVIVISFGFLGTAYLVTSQQVSGFAGKIFGKKISFEKFDQTYQDVRIQAIIRYGDNFNKISQYLDLNGETWDRLILDREANRRKIKVTDSDVIKAIEDLKFFQKNNKFDSSLYNDILRYVFRVQPRDFEESMRQNLRFVKLYEDETRNLALNEEEIAARFQKENEKIKVSYTLVKPELFFKQITFDETKAQDYFNQHKLEFLVPPSINIDYIDIPVSSVADASIKDAVKKQAENILQSLLEKTDIQKLAKQNNLTVKTSGFMNEQNPNLNLGWPLEVLQKIFQLEVGQADGPFEKASSYFIVSVKEKRDAYVPQYDEVKNRVREAVMLNDAKTLAATKAEEYLKTIQSENLKSNNPDFASIIRSLSLELIETPVFHRGEYLPQVGISKPFEDAAFNLQNDNRISNIIETTAGYCILHLDERVAATDEEFKQKREEIIEKLSSERKSEMFTDFMVKLREKSKLEDNISKLKEKAQ